MPKREYKVVGTQSVLEHLPGATFTANLNSDQEAFLLKIGALEVVSGRKSKNSLALRPMDRSSRARATTW